MSGSKFAIIRAVFAGFEGDKIRRIDVYFGATYRNGVFVEQSC